jgi:succinyl-diaminopimelate desuccinylase
MINTLMQLIRIPAVGPENGGEGELRKAEALTEILKKAGFDKIERHDAEDKRVPSGKRPNIVAFCNGNSEQRLWIVTHLDVVPSGEEALWKVTKPFEPLMKENKVYGRGSEDNGQSLVAAVFTIKALKLLGLKPKRTVALAFVADEEMGSTMGIQHLIRKNLFSKKDLVLVPDSGSADGSFIEIAEKSILWFRIHTLGKQTHGSLPNKGLNAHRVGMQVALALDTLLHTKYNAQNGYFDLQTSTFEPTRKDKNVDAVNIIPGEDIVYFDCRVLPQYSLDEVIADINSVLTEHQEKTGAKIQLEILQKQPAPAVIYGNSEMVTLLKKTLKETRNVEAKVGGIGGGTCAAFFRKIGIPAVVWSTIDEVAHQPDEYANIDNMVQDAKVFALLAVS